MGSVNKVILIGNLGRDPEMRFTPSGQSVTQVSVATTRNYRDASKEWQSETEWHSIVIWGEQGERAAEQLRKGNQVFIEGRLQTRSWDDTKNPGVKRYKTEIVADRIQSLEKQERAEGAPSRSEPSDLAAEPVAARASAPSRPAPQDNSDLDDLPF